MQKRREELREVSIREVPMQVGAVATEQYAVYQVDKAKGFKDYFGVHPELVEGAAFFGNSEG